MCCRTVNDAGSKNLLHTSMMILKASLTMVVAASSHGSLPIADRTAPHPKSYTINRGIVEKRVMMAFRSAGGPPRLSKTNNPSSFGSLHAQQKMNAPVEKDLRAS